MMNNKIIIDNEEFEIIVNRKRIKNLYLRVKEENKIEVSANFYTTNKEILVSINIEANEGYMNVSRVTSAYGKKGLNSYLTNKERIVLDFYDKKRTNQWLASRGLQLPKQSKNDSSFNYIICFWCIYF